MDKRPLSQSTRQWLLDQIDLWRAQSLVSEDQANAILDLYESPRQSSARQQSVAIYVLVGIAAMFVGLAAFLLIGYNWTALPDPLKLFILFGAVLGTYALGFSLRYLWEARIFSEFAFFLGCLFYGGSITLIAQIFHLGEHPPDGLWWWALGVIPLALFLDTLLLHLLAVVILAGWVGMELIDHGNHELLLFGILPRACMTLPIFAVMGLLWAYRKGSPTTVGLYVPLVAWWLVLLPLLWDRQNPIFFIGGVGAILLIISEMHADGSRFGIPYRLYGAILCMGVLSVLSFHEIHRDFVRNLTLFPFVLQSLLISCLAGIALAAAFLVQTSREESSYSYARPMYGFVVRQWLPLSMALLMFVMTLWYAAMKEMMADRDSLAAIVPTIAANLGMLVLAFWLMMFGLREDRGFPAGAGVLFFLFWSVLRYAEWFGHRAGMLGGSCMFFVCGAMIFAFAMFWHHRKKQRERGRHELERE